MTTNKRYPNLAGRLMNERILKQAAAAHPLQTLTDQELQRGVLPITRDPQPKKCRAWVRFGPNAVLVDAEVVMWNDVACGIQFAVEEKLMRCWVWSNAVAAVPPPR
ncbi:hypothetical protein ACFVSU_01840 [Microbacterium sp. NPDC058062]|uniref:hypothetical protein n=1 Tax=Microbacterium sp. NPDC058062 TaxID=3346320 RepID=UPI0036DE3C90